MEAEQNTDERWPPGQPDKLTVWLTDGEALSIPRPVNCSKVQYELSCALAEAAQREQQDFTREPLVSPQTPAPRIQLRLGNCLHFHSSPKSFPQPFQSWRSRYQTTEVESQQLFPRLHGSIDPHGLLPLFLPSPTLLFVCDGGPETSLVPWGRGLGS